MNASTERLSSLLKSEKPIAIIPARGGSKRIPRKNIKLFNGEPMISYAISALKKTNLFEEIIVSTDDLEIARISESFGAFIPFMRPEILGGDSIGTVEVIADLVKTLDLKGSRLVCCTYATNPFLDSENLISGFDLILNSLEAEYACAVAKYNYPIQRALEVDSHGLMQMALPENLLIHSQTLEERWHDAGQFYFAKAETWASGKPMLMNTIGIGIDKWRCVDIDDEEDWQKAELLHKISSKI